ncbi:MAG: FAD-dependent oxidoreductase, partial [Georgenia sp.]
MTQTPEQDTFDVVVIGGGSTGENVADYAHGGGMSVAMVENALVGGECSYYACMPSKALLRPGAARAAALRVDGAAQAVAGAVDAAAALRRRTAFTHDWDDSSQVAWAEGAGLTVVRGTARLDGVRRVRVTTGDGDRVLTARHAVVVATGSEPAAPPVAGLTTTRYWTTRDATSTDAVPARLAVIGAGVAGTELAQAFAGLGAAVTLLVRGEVLGAFPAQAGHAVTRGLTDAGVDVRTGVSTTRVERPDGPDGAVVITLDDGTSLTADELLVAAGRRPRTAGLGLDGVGVTLAEGEPLTVDDSGRVRAVAGGWLYAAGDVTGRALMTHQGKYAGRVVGEVVAARAAGRL